MHVNFIPFNPIPIYIARRNTAPPIKILIKPKEIITRRNAFSNSQISEYFSDNSQIPLRISRNSASIPKIEFSTLTNLRILFAISWINFQKRNNREKIKKTIYSTITEIRKNEKIYAR